MANFINEIQVGETNYPIAINSGMTTSAFTIGYDGIMDINKNALFGDGFETNGDKVSVKLGKGLQFIDGDIEMKLGDGLMISEDTLKLHLDTKGPLKISNDSCDGGNYLSMNLGSEFKINNEKLEIKLGDGLTTSNDGQLKLHVASSSCLENTNEGLKVKLGDGLNISEKGAITLDTEAFKPAIHLFRTTGDTSGVTTGDTIPLTQDESGIYLYTNKDGNGNHQIIFRFFENREDGGLGVCETRIFGKSPIKDSGSNPYTPPTIDYRIGTDLQSGMGDWTPLFNTNGGGGTTASVDGHTLKL